MERRVENLRSNLTYATGNILDSSSQCLVNPVNTVGVMGKGLALDFKRAYPNMFDTYKRQCDKGAFKTGRIMFYRMKDDDHIVCLFPTKEHWRNPSKLEYIEDGLKAFVKYYAEWEITSAAFPKLGCGLGGLDWEHHVRPLMERYLGDLPIPIEIYI
jgi:O-acetyl-ADP-ribose deacetylase (regulator of RNase III)